MNEKERIIRKKERKLNIERKYFMIVHYGMIQYHDEKELNLNADDPKKKYLSEIRDG